MILHFQVKHTVISVSIVSVNVQYDTVLIATVRSGDRRPQFM
jgi:hypothetical protein